MIVLLVTLACVPKAPPTMIPDEQVAYRTDDGWRIPLRRYPGGDGSRPPVVLVHGMGANHYNWDYREEISLAHDLQQADWDVWVVGLRGDPGSIAPDDQSARRYAFRDHARLDLPAALDMVQAVTGAEQVHWVGHSMGGLLLYAVLAAQPERIASGVAVCSPVVFSKQLPRHRMIARLGEGMAVRLDTPLIADLGSPLGRANPLYGSVANRSNLDWPIARGLAQEALTAVPRPMAQEAIHWLKSGRLEDIDGTPWLAPADVPVYVLAANHDRVAPPDDVVAACDVLPDCRVQVLGTETGFSVDYGHVDPLLGTTAATEVYPLIRAWLVEQD